MRSQERLDPRTTKEIGRFLEDMRAELTRSVRNILSQRGRKDPDRVADSAAVATEALHEEIQLALVDRHSRHLAQIETALDQLDRREYGVCGECGEFIGLTRLRALPFAQRCRPCQSRAEWAERREARTAPVSAAGWG